MSPTRITDGPFVMSITPFTEAGDLDESALRDHLDVMAEAGVGIFLCSQGSGEGDLLSSAEKVRMYEIGVEVGRGRVPVWSAGIGLGNPTREVVALARAAVEAGVDGVYVLGPRPGPGGMRPAEIERYYREVLAGIDAPVMLSDNSFLTGYPLPEPLVPALVEDHPTVRAVLFSDPGANTLTRAVDHLVTTVGDRVDVLIGLTPMLPTAYALGARGFLCNEGNVAPALTASVWHTLESGDAGRIFDGMRRLMAVNLLCTRFASPRSLKHAVHVLGRDGGHVRAPYGPLEPAELATFTDLVRALDLGPA